MAIQRAAGTYYGQVQKRCEVGGLIFAESVYTTDLHLPRHQHVNAFLHFVVEGHSTEVCERRTRLVGPSHLAFHPAGEEHENHWHGNGGRIFHIEIEADRLAHLRQHAPALNERVDFHDGLPGWLSQRLYREYRRPDDLAPLALEGLTLEVLAELTRRRVRDTERHPPRWLLQARDLLHDRFNEPLRFDAIATAVGVHPVHLARVFRQRFGCTPGDYVRRLRVEFACRQLSTSALPLVEVALAAGFSDQSHFTKTFKRHMGLTPAEYQKNSVRAKGIPSRVSGVQEIAGVRR